VPKLSVRAGMAQGLRPGKRPVIAIGWPDLKADRSWCACGDHLGWQHVAATRRGVSCQSVGYTYTLLQMLQTLVTPNMHLILVADAGFRTQWLETASAIDWA